ncbi:PH domain-like protein [Cucurbitaria berberidis CBS 394.84]|uniref:PH domain-like protein n=1 Tax=Cucurbitaria berberidis CBS 394.84 TaxID=1168544 RepID=A0A9P4GQZ6_9PLEO|nr:PH domain-like protein [Cucurbitaria berberidis CBS 394.84]KAF1851103.1 PH domain-like protein [Cucurbitaria berberidis CBS 394.84]
MAPPRAKARASHPQPPPQPSDYETDAPPAAVDVPLPPPRSNEELNFSVLGRIYPHLVAIEHVTPYAALYTFNLDTQQWEKVGIEGTLFICQLTPSPMGVERYCVIIYNRRGLDNFYLDLTSSDDMEITDPYVILQGDEVVYGIWIFADPPPASTANCRVETGNKMMEIADKARASRESKEREHRHDIKEATDHVEAPSSAPMGRQLSLRELFGQQREQDAGFSVHNHHSHPIPHQYPQQGYLPTQAPGPAQQDVLGQLFMKAKQDYNGLG